MYTGEADWTLIGEVKNNPRMHIPIIGNGDVTTPQRAKECFDRYGVDAVMIGRASFGRPWIFKEVKHYLETGEEIPPLSSEWKLNVLRQEVEDSVKLLDERRGILHVRRHLAASRCSRVSLTSGKRASPCCGQRQRRNCTVSSTK